MKEIDELREHDNDQLLGYLKECKIEVHRPDITVDNPLSPNTMRKRNLRRTIARTLTILRERGVKVG